MLLLTRYQDMTVVKISFPRCIVIHMKADDETQYFDESGVSLSCCGP